MNKKNKWITSIGSIMFFYVFDIKDKNGSGVMADVNLRLPDNSGFKPGISFYEIRDNIDLNYAVGEKSERNIIVENPEELKMLNKLPIKRDVIKWTFSKRGTI